MPVTQFEIRNRRRFAEGQAFGDTGLYELVEGVLHFVVDPDNESNSAIVDIGRAARNGQGAVEFECDVALLRPVDAAKANGRLLCDAPREGVPVFTFGGLGAPDSGEALDGAAGYLMREGWTIASIGWQWDVRRDQGKLGLSAPQALGDDGKPIEGSAYYTFQPDVTVPHHLLSDFGNQPYTAASLDQPDARLIVRDFPNGTRQDVLPDRWQFGRVEGGKVVPDASYITVEDGFEGGRYYEVVYRTDMCPVVGTGLLAFRDAASFFRYSTADSNPLSGQVSHVLALGVTQTGRFLREFLHVGGNVDEAGHTVFDGVHIHAAGARRGEFNFRYAHPSTNQPYGLGTVAPFAYEETTDPFTKEPVPGILARLRARNAVPRIVATETGGEYWRGDASMAHIAPNGSGDLPEPAEGRSYYFAGTQEAPGALPLERGSNENAPVTTANPVNVVDYSPLFRAAFANLAGWACDGVEPPPSAIPFLADRSAVTRDRTMYDVSGMTAIYQVLTRRMWNLPTLGLGDRVAEGIGEYPPMVSLTKVYPAYVSAVDTDGNEIAGVRLPDVSVAVATHIGWNPRDNSIGGLDETYQMWGSSVPFPASIADQERVADPRAPISERYTGREDYTARVRVATEALVSARHLLAEDAAVVEANALARWDAVVGAGVAS